MDQNQINQVKSVVENYFSLDIAKVFADAYKNEKDFNNILIGDFTAEELIETLNKVFAQFRDELDTSYAKSLPFQYNFQNEFGNGNCHNDLNQIVSYIQNKQFPNIPSFLKRVVHYQAVNGFWEKSKRKYFRVKEEELIKEKERINLVSEHLNSLISQSQEFFSSIEEKENQLDNFIKQKQSELSEIESLLLAARQHSNELTDINTKASSLLEKINSYSESSSEKSELINDLFKTITTQQKESKKLTNTIQNILSQYTESLKALNEDYVSKIELVSSKTEYFEERNEYLNKLIGREVGASLFETFKQRKKELEPSVSFWKWAVPVATIATIAWIFFLFGNGNVSEMTIELFGINTLKTIPAVFLLLFAISQYTKERHFQEEYAFKSAVALTINAYADQLNDLANKDKLIMESVLEIYKTPMEQSKRKNTDSKAAIETAKGLADVAKGLVNK